MPEIWQAPEVEAYLMRLSPDTRKIYVPGRLDINGNIPIGSPTPAIQRSRLPQRSSNSSAEQWERFYEMPTTGRKYT